MRRTAIFPVISILLLSACMVVPHRGGGLEVVPILPTVVELDGEGYYAQGGYHYFYTNNQWYYSDSRNGRRSELPRSHWPRETRYRGGERR
jgi:hypothetical protein